ncbi:MAG: flagellar basal body P-ring formation protein FlgA [Planctomycetes bacterium]|nr:flagellar basal body P-ring formation protein FlgA [Planctomycetota bacterium]
MTDLATITLCLATVFGGGERGAVGGDEVEVRIRTGAIIRGNDVRISELCDITPINGHTLEIGNIVFAPTPSSGHARTITRAEIVQALAAAGHDVGKLTFAGPNEIVVQPVRSEIPTTELLETASAALQALLTVEGGDVEIEAPTRMRRYDAPPGRIRRELIARVRTGRTAPSSAVVDVEVLVDGQRCINIPIQFKLQRYQMLLKTVGVIRKGTALGPQNLTIAREPLAQATGLYLARFENVLGMEAARNLQSNSRITLGDIQPPAVIHRGDIVTVVLTKGRVKVTAKAMANHDAPMGERITLTNMQSRGSLTGVVAAPGLVIIHN